MSRETDGFSELFPKPAAEDRDFCDRWLRAGHEIRRVLEIVVNHYHEVNTISLSGSILVMALVHFSTTKIENPSLEYA